MFIFIELKKITVSKERHIDTTSKANYFL